MLDDAASWRRSGRSAMLRQRARRIFSWTRPEAGLITDRVWRTNRQLELATIVWVAWFNHAPAALLDQKADHRSSTKPSIRRRVPLRLEPLPAQAAPTVTDLRSVRTVASPMGGSEE